MQGDFNCDRRHEESDIENVPDTGLMPVSLFTAGIEPEDPDTPIRRFMEFWKFQDLMKGHMYFRRADLFDDETEGLPLDDYIHTLGLNPYDLNDIQTRNHALGFDAQMRQGFYMTCWYLAGEETARMWHGYANGNGVAICSTYRALKSILEPLAADDPHLGLVRYGNKHLTYPRRNLMVNISTKRECYADEKEVRAMLWIRDPHESGNRHIGPDNRFHPRPIYPTPNPEGVWRQVDVQRLISEVIVSPFAGKTAQVDVEEAIRDGGYTFMVRPSDMTSRARFLPTADELRRFT